MEFQEQSLPVPEAGHPVQAIGIGQALTLLLVGLAVDILSRVFLSAAGFRFFSVPSLLVPQVLMWSFLLWAGIRMGGSVRAVAAFSMSRRLLVPVVLASLGAAIILPQVAGLLPMPDRLIESLRKAKDIGVLPFALSVGLIAPITEEMFFRGIVLRGFLARYSTRKAVWASAILFAAMHLNPWQAIIALPLGLAYAYIVIRTGSIWPCVLSHAVVNLSHNFLTPGLLKLWGYSDENVETLRFLPYPLLAFGAIALVIGSMWVVREIDRQSRLKTSQVQS